jgi:hypothetical protein
MEFGFSKGLCSVRVRFLKNKEQKHPHEKVISSFLFYYDSFIINYMAENIFLSFHTL